MPAVAICVATLLFTAACDDGAAIDQEPPSVAAVVEDDADAAGATPSQHPARPVGQQGIPAEATADPSRVAGAASGGPDLLRVEYTMAPAPSVSVTSTIQYTMGIPTDSALLVKEGQEEVRGDLHVAIPMELEVVAADPPFDSSEAIAGEVRLIWHGLELSCRHTRTVVIEVVGRRTTFGYLPLTMGFVDNLTGNARARWLYVAVGDERLLSDVVYSFEDVTGQEERHIEP
jgi:hypothetical protein